MRGPAVSTVRAALAAPRGFTLVELMVAVALLALVMAAVLTVQMTGTTVATTGQNRAEAQQTARAVMLIEEELRRVGYGFPSGQTTFVAASPTDVTFWADVLNASTTLTADAAANATSLSVVSSAGISVGDTIYLINGDQWETLSVSSVSAGTIGVGTGPAVLYPQGAQVGRPRQIRYSWNPATQTLSKDAGDGTGLLPLATGVQNLQFRYFDAANAEIAPANLAANLGNIRRIDIAVTAQSAAAQHRGQFTLTSTVSPRNLVP